MYKNKKIVDIPIEIQQQHAKLSDLSPSEKAKIGSLIKKLAEEKEQKLLIEKQMQKQQKKYQKGLVKIQEQKKQLIEQQKKLETKFLESLNYIKKLNDSSIASKNKQNSNILQNQVQSNESYDTPIKPPAQNVSDSKEVQTEKEEIQTPKLIQITQKTQKINIYDDQEEKIEQDQLKIKKSQTLAQINKLRSDVEQLTKNLQMAREPSTSEKKEQSLQNSSSKKVRFEQNYNNRDQNDQIPSKDYDSTFRTSKLEEYKQQQPILYESYQSDSSSKKNQYKKIKNSLNNQKSQSSNQSSAQKSIDIYKNASPPKFEENNSIPEDSQEDDDISLARKWLEKKNQLRSSQRNSNLSSMLQKTNKDVTYKFSSTKDKSQQDIYSHNQFQNKSIQKIQNSNNFTSTHLNSMFKNQNIDSYDEKPKSNTFARNEPIYISKKPLEFHQNNQFKAQKFSTQFQGIQNPDYIKLNEALDRKIQQLSQQSQLHHTLYTELDDQAQYKTQQYDMGTALSPGQLDQSSHRQYGEQYNLQESGRIMQYQNYVNQSRQYEQYHASESQNKFTNSEIQTPQIQKFGVQMEDKLKFNKNYDVQRHLFQNENQSLLNDPGQVNDDFYDESLFDLVDDIDKIKI